jgi:hypothetical protein
MLGWFAGGLSQSKQKLFEPVSCTHNSGPDKPYTRRIFQDSLLIFILGISGCASNHNLKKDGVNYLGGGFSDVEIGPGFYRLTALGNQSPWPSERAARGTWQNRAQQLCGKGAYQEIGTHLDDGFQGYVPSGVGLLEARAYNTSLSGYLLCDSSNMTRDEALELLENQRKTSSSKFTSEQEQALADLGGKDCISSKPQTPIENFYRRGKLLLSIQNYSAALTCLIMAQENKEDTVIYQDACATIGMMYELGWGVERDLATAKHWYQKAGM